MVKTERIKDLVFHPQVIRYILVGATVNLCGYLIYLLVTWFFLPPKIAVSVLYPVGALLGYFMHARYSFAYSGSHRSGLVRFAIAHLFGYFSNIFFLYLGTDLLGYPHELVQLVAIIVVAGQLFLTFKFFVYRHANEPVASAVVGHECDASMPASGRIK